MKLELSDKVKKFIRFVGPRVWLLLCISIFIGFFWFVVESAFIVILQGFLISIGVFNPAESTLPHWYPQGIKASLIILFVYGIFRFVVFVSRIAISSMASQYFLCDQREHILRYSLENASSVATKEVVALFTDNLGQASGVIQQLINLSVALVAVIMFFILGVHLAPVEMIVSVSLLAILLFPFRFLARMIDRAGAKVHGEWSKISESLLQGMKNFFLLSVYDMVKVEQDRGTKSLRAYRDHYNRYAWISAISGGIPLLIGVSIIAGTTYLSKRYMTTPPLTLVAFFYIFIRLAQAASDLNMVLGSIRVYRPSFMKVYRWNRDTSKIRKKFTDVVKTPIASIDEIQFDKVTFGFRADDKLFKDLSFRLTAPFTLVIRGESGIGKSTLLSLMVGLLDPESGHVKINGCDIAKEPIDFHRRLAYGGPEPFLIADSVRQNLLYGHPAPEEVTDERIWVLLEKFEMAAVIRSLPNGLDEMLMELAQLSTGQKQRISLARAVLRSPSLFLMDEPTANLDDETESKIIREIFAGSKTSSFVIVTHKDSFDAYATKIVEVKKQGFQI